MRFIVALVLAFGVAAVAMAQSNRPSPGPGGGNQQPKPVTQTAQQQPADDLRGTDKAPLVVRVLPTPKTQQETAQDEAQRSDESSANWWMVRLTGFIGIIGLIQAFVFWIQAGRLKATIDKMDEIAKSQAADTKSYIGAASRSAEAMERVADSIGSNVETTTAMAATQRDFWGRQMRAYVLPESAAIWDGMTLDVPQPAKKDVPGVVVTIRNSGATPAYDVVSWAAIDVIDVKNEGALSAPKLQPQFTNTLAPHGAFTKAVWFHRAITPHEISDIETGVRGIYVYGRVEYQDVLGKEDRFSNFRFRYNGGYPPNKGAIFNFSDTGNDAN